MICVKGRGQVFRGLLVSFVRTFIYLYHFLRFSRFLAPSYVNLKTKKFQLKMLIRSVRLEYLLLIGLYLLFEADTSFAAISESLKSV